MVVAKKGAVRQIAFGGRLKRILVPVLGPLLLFIAPISAVGEGSLVQLHPSESASASTPGPDGDPKEAAGETEQTWLERHVTFIGDVRAALAVDKLGKRDGSDLTEVKPAVRLRGGAAISFLPWLEMTARLALRIDDDIDGFDFRLKSDGGIEAGDVTFDKLFLTLTPHELITIEGGRLQTSFEVDSVVKDSLSRNDSGGLDINWTDGIHVILGRPSSFNLHLIGQANPDGGSTNGVGAQGPLDFEEDASSITYYVGLEAPPVEPFTQLFADVTIIPQALRPEGLGSDEKENIVAFTLKGAADFPLHWLEPIVLHPFGEFGVMVWTPQENVLEISNSTERADRFAFVAGVDLKNLGPGSLGFQFNWTQPGYLISPDYPNNAWSIETRYKVPIAKRVTLELRYRHRQEIEKLVDAQQRQTDDNVLARITVKF
ncbi:MAG: hypothetical protein ACE5MG_12865 [Candidatus Methylomirabilales bacterium]